MGIQAPAEVKYRIIFEAIRSDGNMLNISTMCSIAGVSRSGFYAWMDASDRREKSEERDLSDYAKIKAAYDYRGYAKRGPEASTCGCFIRTRLW